MWIGMFSLMSSVEISYTYMNKVFANEEFFFVVLSCIGSDCFL